MVHCRSNCVVCQWFGGTHPHPHWHNIAGPATRTSLRRVSTPTSVAGSNKTGHVRNTEDMRSRRQARTVDVGYAATRSKLPCGRRRLGEALHPGPIEDDRPLSASKTPLWNLDSLHFLCDSILEVFSRITGFVARRRADESGNRVRHRDMKLFCECLVVPLQHLIALHHSWRHP